MSSNQLVFQDLFDRQRSYFAADATKSYEWRVDQLDRLIRMLKENFERFSEASKRDFKTALSERVFEVAASIGSIEAIKAQLAGWMEPTEAPIPKFLAATGHKGMVHREPYGVTLVICPFNGPLLLSLRPAATALSAGNPVMLKLAEQTSATNAVLLELVPKYFDPAALTALTVNRERMTAILKLPFDFIFLTGSVAAGKAVMRAAAEHLTPVLLELGGQNPAIVDATANLPDAAKKIVWGAMAWGGQWCVSPGYAAVHESVAEAFVAACKKALVELYGEDPRTNPDHSRIITSQTVKRLASLIDPAKVVAGGRFDEAARYFDPDASLSGLMVRRGHAGRDLRSDPAYPDLLRSRGIDCDDQVAAQAPGRIRVQPGPEGDRPVNGLVVLRRWRRQSDQCLPVHRDDALWRSRHLGHRPLLRKAWVRRPHARQVDSRLASRRRHRSPLPALYRGEGEGSRAVVRLLKR